MASHNGSVIQTDMAGAAGGYGGIVIHPKGFTVENTAGSAGAESSFKFTFRYSSTARTWVLESIDTDSYSKDDDPPHNHEHLSANFGDVTFEAFDASPYGIAAP